MRIWSIKQFAEVCCMGEEKLREMKLYQAVWCSWGGGWYHPCLAASLWHSHTGTEQPAQSSVGQSWQCQSGARCQRWGRDLGGETQPPQLPVNAPRTLKLSTLLRSCVEWAALQHQRTRDQRKEEQLHSPNPFPTCSELAASSYHSKAFLELALKQPPQTDISVENIHLPLQLQNQILPGSLFHHSNFQLFLLYGCHIFLLPLPSLTNPCLLKTPL